MGAVGVGLQIAGQVASFFGQRDQTKAYWKAQQQKRTNAITTMNYAFQNVEGQRKDLFDRAVAELTDMQRSNKYIQSSSSASIGEDIGEGRTADLLNRSVEAQGLHAMSQAKDNYMRQSNEADLNKEQQYINMKTFVQGLDMPKMPSAFGSLLGIAGAFAGYKSQEEAVKAFMMSKGLLLNGKGNGRRYAFKDPNINLDWGVLPLEETLARQYNPFSRRIQVNPNINLNNLMIGGGTFGNIYK